MSSFLHEGCGGPTQAPDPCHSLAQGDALIRIKLGKAPTVTGALLLESYGIPPRVLLSHVAHNFCLCEDGV